ncbi:hypothetical protein BGW39_011457 [Mortierella sp. 14UC]|nr:hypothetical protein BGW39_011457 [Mortierella sp. 14UC]
MALALARIHHDLILNISPPILGEDPPNDTMEIERHLCADKLNWSPELWSASIISNVLQQGSPNECEFDASLVTQGDAYSFDIVIMQLEVTDSQPTQSSLTNQDVFPLLLKDIGSVDICFECRQSGGITQVGLWAHRVILCRHKAFARLIQDEEVRHHLIHQEANMSKDKDTTAVQPEPTSKSSLPEYDSIYNNPATTACSPSSSTPCVESLVVKVDKFSHATMCALLDYIYTNEIRRSIDPTRFAISKCRAPTSSHHPSKAHPSVHWHSLSDYSSWTVRTASWYELLDAAKHFNILDLCAYCQYKIIKEIDDHTVVPILFSNSGRDYAVRKAAMTFIVENLASMFGENKDPFVLYENFLECHDILVELTRLRLRKICASPVATAPPNCTP